MYRQRLIGFVVMHVALWKRFYSHVSDIRKNLKELEEFQQDDSDDFLIV